MRNGAFAVVINSKNQVLLVRSSTTKEYVDYWSFPGGVVEPDEHAKVGAAREVFEEVGIECLIEELIDESVNNDKNILISIFRAKYISGDILLQEDEIVDARWFSIEDGVNLPLAFNCRNILLSIQSDLVI